MKAIFGLGNPGVKYSNNRHNIGYMVVELCAQKKNILFKRKNILYADIAYSKIYNEDVLFIKPKTFMNNSGLCVKKVLSYYKILNKDVLIICDDVNLPFGTLRLKEKGSSGGHNGLKSIIGNIETDRINRLRIGISKPDNIEMANYVLSDFSPQEKNDLELILKKATSALFDWIKYGSKYVMSNYNKNFLNIQH